MYILFFCNRELIDMLKNKYNNYQNQVVSIQKIIQHAFLHHHIVNFHPFTRVSAINFISL